MELGQEKTDYVMSVLAIADACLRDSGQDVNGALMLASDRVGAFRWVNDPSMAIRVLGYSDHPNAVFDQDDLGAANRWDEAISSMAFWAMLKDVTAVILSA